MAVSPGVSRGLTEPAQAVSAAVSEDSPRYFYHTRRRDGERPLSITAGTVSILTLYLDIASLHHQVDWRTITFYTGFCVMGALASAILSLQWRNERVEIGVGGLDYYDWLGRQTPYSWSDTTHATLKSRPDNRRFILELRKARHVVLHGDIYRYEEVVEFCKSRLSGSGVDVVVE